MKLKSIALVAALSLGSVAAHATTSVLGTGVLGPTIDTSGGLAWVSSFVYDNFTFSLTAASTVESNVTTFAGNINPAAYGIYTAGADAVVGTGDDVAVSALYSFSSVSTAHQDVLAAGSYHFKVFGFANANSGYSIAAKAVAVPVPEPETYALLAAGLGVIGFVARRRRDF